MHQRANGLTAFLSNRGQTSVSQGPASNRTVAAWFRCSSRMRPASRAAAIRLRRQSDVACNRWTKLVVSHLLFVFALFLQDKKHNKFEVNNLSKINPLKIYYEHSVNPSH